MLNLTLTVVLGLLVAALVLAVIRLTRGPTLADRVISLDLISMIIAAFIAAYCVYMRQPVLLDAVVVLAIIAFFGTVAFARYLEKKATHDS
jgi:multicomponent Na+:H+ antiporter subunit F